MSSGRNFGEGDVRVGERSYNWKGREGWGPEDYEDDVAKSSGLFQFSISERSVLSRAEKLLAGIADGLEKAVKSAASRTETHLKSSSTKAVAERYAVTAATIRAEENVEVSYSFAQGAQVNIIFSGYKIPLYRFAGASPKNPARDMSRRVGIMFGSSLDTKTGDDVFKWRLVHPSLPASGHALKSTAPYRFQDAFTAHFKSGHTGIFERTNEMSKHDREQIQELYGPSVPQMLGNDEVAKKVADDTMEYFDKRMEHEIDRILSGYGG